jgi:hypothetical protein
MTRLVVFDRSVIDQVNAGNADTARVVRNLAISKARIWMTRADNSRLFRDAEQRLLGELNVNSPLQDINPARYERQMHGAKRSLILAEAASSSGPHRGVLNDRVTSRSRRWFLTASSASG